MSSLEKVADPEAGKLPTVSEISDDADSGSLEELRAKELQQSKGVLRGLRTAEEWLDSKLGIELRGIDRIPEEEKRPPSILNVFFLWWSLNVHVGVLPLGMLGPQFGLSFHQSLASSIIGICLGALCTAYTGTLGPKLGLRAIATSRYSFGFWGAKLCSILNVVIGGGYAVVNFVTVGQILSAVSEFHMSITVGIVIIAVVSYIVSVFGFRLIHTFEKYSWIATFILMIVLISQVGKYVVSDEPAEGSGIGLAGSYLTILAINFSNSSGWCSIAADYYCNYPSKTSFWKIFGLTFFGIIIPTTFTTTIGTCLGSIATNPHPGPPGTVAHTLKAAYTDHGIGGLLFSSLHDKAFSKFTLIVFTFSVLGNNIAITYSSGLSLQLLGHYFHAIPRFIWSLLVAIVVAVLAIAGREHLSTIVSDFVSMLGYWTVSFTIILLIEDKWFRRHEGYNLLVWDKEDKLPLGAAAVLALLTGYLGGGVPGMSQTWYNGIVSRQFGPYGGDVGIYLSGALTLVSYPIYRTLERRWTGR